MSGVTWSSLLFLFSSLSCAASGPATKAGGEARKPAPIAPPVVARERAPAVANPTAVQRAPSGKATCKPFEPVEGIGHFERVYTDPVTSLALGKKSRAALISGANAKLFDGASWVEIEPPLPESLHVEVFFGRDNEPRLLGYAVDASSRVTPYYRRRLRGSWQPAKDELGRLGTARSALYGVLGHDDPEVVCAVNEICIVKRLSGWSSAAAHSELARVHLGDGAVWALRPGAVERLNAGVWTALEPQHEWQRPIAIWSDARGGVLVIEDGKDEVHRLGDAKWDRLESPIRGPKSVWASSMSDVWLVGEGGAAHFDGAAWSCLNAVPGPLSAITAGPEALWFSGAAGAFRSPRKPAPPQPR